MNKRKKKSEIDCNNNQNVLRGNARDCGNVDADFIQFCFMIKKIANE